MFADLAFVLFYNCIPNDPIEFGLCIMLTESLEESLQGNTVKR